MTPYWPFLAGLAAGAAVVSVLRSERVRGALNDAGERLHATASEMENGVRAATRTGLDWWQRAANVAERQPDPAAPAAPTPATAPEPAPAPKRKRARKPAAGAAAEAVATPAKPRRAARKVASASGEA